ncbi:hypothetical protein M422DRAFT_258553 [Sphaerobolus stellatus SS14]|uniref:Uncharacterized protein n=1 Tax=Sphaerobolus stellatus (strain SS14) TaxID=990650 RepID=A0A0C9VLZ3_SPHS4|nr:hypothetical protein M422DRAFT_258553 [Sphaerobolus stellatus SS14]
MPKQSKSYQIRVKNLEKARSTHTTKASPVVPTATVPSETGKDGVENQGGEEVFEEEFPEMIILPMLFKVVVPVLSFLPILATANQTVSYGPPKPTPEPIFQSNTDENFQLPQPQVLHFELPVYVQVTLNAATAP